MPDDRCRCGRCPGKVYPVLFDRQPRAPARAYEYVGRVLKITNLGHKRAVRLVRQPGGFVVEVRKDFTTIATHEFDDRGRAEVVYDALVKGEALPR